MNGNDVSTGEPATSKCLNKRNANDHQWQYFPNTGLSFESCKPWHIGNGIILNDHLTNGLEYYDDIIFQSLCYDGSPIYNSMRLSAFQAPYLPKVQHDWKKYTTSDIGGFENGKFSSAIYPLIYSLTSNVMITVFFTISVFVSLTGSKARKGTMLLKIACVLATINMTIFLARSISSLKLQHEKHSTAGTSDILHLLQTDKTYVSLEFISTFFLNVCQVFNIENIFIRRQERKIIFYCGLLFVMCSNILWAICCFISVSTTRYDKLLVILTPFVYLFRIALSSTYACFIISYGMSERCLIFASFDMAFLTFVAFCLILLQPTLFIVDVSDVFSNGIGDMFNTTCYIGSTIIVWEWMDRMSLFKWKKQAQSILGRPIYEDEQVHYNFARYALKVQDALLRNSNKDEIQSLENQDDDNIDANHIRSSVSELEEGRSCDQPSLDEELGYCNNKEKSSQSKKRKRKKNAKEKLQNFLSRQNSKNLDVPTTSKNHNSQMSLLVRKISSRHKVKYNSDIIEMISLPSSSLSATSTNSTMTISNGTTSTSNNIRYRNNYFDQQSINQIQFENREPLVDVISSGLSNWFYKTRQSTKEFLQRNSKTILSKFSTNVEVAEKRNLVKKRIGLEKSDAVYVYRTKNIDFYDRISQDCEQYELGTESIDKHVTQSSMGAVSSPTTDIEEN
ncbi:hypothetical protein TBLA_0B08500 [Henningerozyma blattae CBS 6284]|uniref:pH-response regulator protein palH/RIM21 n=1 Tax=Henningerozyma blattae (strain ATCC 34711 / CBS 6284 / DSM 70876 / NBRC 10599 / NRRL Y-10934 / UCD 77-7) TaxID=1071380 RepID=I2GZW3_HENB6|nr:hypothetical protein TBLA_0B08500 [Tetrapisispora blattae CBS 6284]CCH59665.1 hypothetical protein TBLA_0B08500 [Tetrapisispora blattae CBS 6284]